ncbi:MAG: hypothetical protein J4F36_08945 [Nitrosopumilaceae archaeon]|nr:hypothetical protein [Nitrosopumilaceae archaeon]
MENMVNKHLEDLYGLNPNTPHMALQFPRLPPGLTHPMFKLHQNPVKEQFSRDVETINQKLQGFQHMYQQYASGLLTGNGIIPPGHPLYTKQNSVQTLQTENDKLLKENTELKKKLKKESKKQN